MIHWWRGFPPTSGQLLKLPAHLSLCHKMLNNMKLHMVYRIHFSLQICTIIGLHSYIKRYQNSRQLVWYFLHLLCVILVFNLDLDNLSPSQSSKPSILPQQPSSILAETNAGEHPSKDRLILKPTLPSIYSRAYAERTRGYSNPICSSRYPLWGLGQTLRLSFGALSPHLSSRLPLDWIIVYSPPLPTPPVPSMALARSLYWYNLT